MNKELTIFAPEGFFWGGQIGVRDGYIDRFTGLEFLCITRRLELRSVEGKYTVYLPHCKINSIKGLKCYDQ